MTTSSLPCISGKGKPLFGFPTRFGIMPQCSVPGCTQQGGHKFPNDSLLRKAWIIAIKRDHPGKKGKMWIPCQTARVCHSHFKDDDFVAKNFYGNYINGKKCCFHINVM